MKPSTRHRHRDLGTRELKNASQRKRNGHWAEQKLENRESGQLKWREVYSVQFSSIQSLSHVWLFMTPWTATRQASLYVTNSWSLLKLMPIKLVMPSNHLIFCRPLLLPPSIPPSIRVFSNELVLHIRWPKYWSFSFSIQWTPRTDLL